MELLETQDIDKSRGKKTEDEKERMEKVSEHVREGEKEEKGNKSIMVEALFLK